MTSKKNKERAAKAAMRKYKKRPNVLHAEKVGYIDYKDVNLLQRFMSDRSKLRARRMNGNTVQQQRDVALAVKNAREMALLPYTKRVASARAPRRGEEDGSYNDRPRRSRDRDSNESLADTYKDVIEAAVEAPFEDEVVTDTVVTEEAAS
jgi:small subunit ribosomal protein S18